MLLVDPKSAEGQPVLARRLLEAERVTALFVAGGVAWPYLSVADSADFFDNNPHQH